MQPSRPVTAAEYPALERASETKHELANGAVLAMSGASPAHNLLAMNLGRRLAELVAARPCVVLTSDQRVHVPATGLFAYPDLTVVCGHVERHPEDDLTITNPAVLAEVLSDSTERYDRGAKFAHYQAIASLEEYVLVSTKERRVEHYRRQPNGAQWLLTIATGAGAEVAFPALGGAVRLADIYDKWEMVSPT